MGKNINVQHQPNVKYIMKHLNTMSKEHLITKESNVVVQSAGPARLSGFCYKLLPQNISYKPLTEWSQATHFCFAFYSQPLNGDSNCLTGCCEQNCLVRINVF